MPGEGWLRPEGNGVGFVTVQDVKVVDPLPAQAIFLSASGGGVYDAASHSVTWEYSSWNLQSPITSTVTVKYPEGTFNIGDTVTNTATITAAVKNDPATKLSKTAEFTHGFGKRFSRGSIDKGARADTYAVRGDSDLWIYRASNDGNTALHYRWEDVMPCLWSSEDAKAVGDACDKPAVVGPYDFYVRGKGAGENIGSWTLEYWTNKGSHEVVTYTQMSVLKLPEGEWITRFTIDTDLGPGERPILEFHGKISNDIRLFRVECG